MTPPWFRRRSEAAVRRQARNWSMRMHGDDAAQHRAAFEHWRAADLRHAVAYQRLEQHWRMAGMLAQTEIGRSRALPRRERVQTIYRFGFALAAAALLLVIGLGVWMIQPGDFGAGRLPAHARLASDVGEIRKLRLPDGSTITLDTDSALRLAFSPTQRRLVLTRGRARFEVAHDSNRPFVVVAGTGAIVARGTIFDVSLFGDHVTVTLLRGSVDVHENTRRAADRAKVPVRLRPGQSTAFTPSGPIAPPQRAVGVDTDWISGMLSFDAERLGEAIADANRYNRIKISVADPALNDLQITGAYHVQDAASFARAIAASFELRTAVTPTGGIVISKPEPPEN